MMLCHGRVRFVYQPLSIFSLPGIDEAARQMPKCAISSISPLPARLPPSYPLAHADFRCRVLDAIMPAYNHMHAAGVVVRRQPPRRRRSR